MTPLASSDVLPPLRHNLLFSDDPQALGDALLSVTNLTTGEELRDGQRTAGEVVHAAGRVGLPRTLTGLHGFVNKLVNADLVGDDGDGPQPFQPRDLRPPPPTEVGCGGKPRVWRRCCAT